MSIVKSFALGGVTAAALLTAGFGGGTAAAQPAPEGSAPLEESMEVMADDCSRHMDEMGAMMGSMMESMGPDGMESMGSEGSGDSMMRRSERPDS